LKVLDDLICMTFPECDRSKLSQELRLGEIEGWDSMSAVSFSLELETLFHVKIGDNYFRSDQTLKDVIAFLSSQGVHI
jgi:acyl carrier protein